MSFPHQKAMCNSNEIGRAALLRCGFCPCSALQFIRAPKGGGFLEGV